MKKEDKLSIGLGAATIPSFLLGGKLAIRGKRLRSLQKLKPKFSTSNVKSFQNKLAPGDVLIFGASTKGKNLGTKITTNVFRLSEGYHIHSAVYLGNGKIAHINPGKTPEIYNLSKYMQKGDKGVISIRPKATKAQNTKVVSLANEAVLNKSIKYKSPLANKLAIFGDMKVGQKIKDMCAVPGNNRNCASFVGEIQRKAGIKIGKNPTMLTSVDLRPLGRAPVARYLPKGMKPFKTSKLQGVPLMLPAVAQATYEYKRRKR